jgi:hypothetical protein
MKVLLNVTATVAFNYNDVYLPDNGDWQICTECLAKGLEDKKP